MSSEHLIEILRRIATELENMSIEADVYKKALLNRGFSTLDELNRLRDSALADPDIRRKAQQDFSYMWNSLKQAGVDAWIEETAKQPPPSGKPS